MPTTLARATAQATVAATLILAATPGLLHALRTAAGGTSGTSGFANAVTFLNNLGTYTIYLAAPLGILGFVAGGAMLIAGSPDGPKWLARTAIGVGLVLLSKGIVA